MPEKWEKIAEKEVAFLLNERNKTVNRVNIEEQEDSPFRGTEIEGYIKISQTLLGWVRLLKEEGGKTPKED